MQKSDDIAMSILVPVPLTGDYKIPLKQASFFHHKYGAEITVLNVVHEIPFLERWLSPRRLEKHRRKALKKLKRLVKSRFGDDSMFGQMNFRVVTGDIVSSILKVAGDMQADLIIIKKARRAEGGRRFLKQENADRLIANSECPVLTIYKKHTKNGINRILLPVDITKKTEKKVAWAISMAKRFGAEIHVVSVRNMNLHRAHSFSYKKGRRIEEDIRREGIKVKLVMLEKEDKPMEDVVLGYAAEYDPDLLLIMTHQESTLYENYLGSFAREIIHQAKMPVFSVIPLKESLVSRFIDSFAERSLTGGSSSQSQESADK